jgi:hypothetical protein
LLFKVFEKVAISDEKQGLNKSYKNTHFLAEIAKYSRKRFKKNDEKFSLFKNYENLAFQVVARLSIFS